MSRIAILVLGALALLLGGVIALESAPGPLGGTAPLPADAIRPGPVAPSGGGIRQVQDWVDTILARPLFLPSRRPPASVAGVSPSGPGFPRLTGIVIVQQQREAIFVVPGKTQPVVVRAGSRLDGVLIQSIGAGWVMVVDAAGPRMIRPSFATGPTPASAPASAPAAVTVDLPSVPSPAGAAPFASIRGLSGRPLGLAAQPDTTPPDGGAITIAPSLPAPAPPGGSP